MSETSKQADLVILTILPEEMSAVVAALCAPGNFLTESGDNNYHWCGGELMGSQGQLRVIVGRSSAAGNDKMQAAATDGLQRFHPKVLLVVGVAGGIPKGSDPMFAGDIVVGDAVWSIDRGAISDAGIDSRPQSHPVGAGLLQGIQSVGNDTSFLARGLKNADGTTPTVICGGIAAANYVVKVQEHELFQAISRVTGNAVRAVEMESWGAAQSIQAYALSSGTAVRFGIVRGLSDIVRPKANGADAEQHSSLGDANSRERDDWKQRAANNAASLVAAWIKHAWPVAATTQNTPVAATNDRVTKIDKVSAFMSVCEPSESATSAASPADADRIRQTRSKILACLGQDHFQGIPNLKFKSDGLPEGIGKAFPPATARFNRVDIAQACIDAVLAFARDVADAVEATASATPALAPKRKEQLWKRLVNAMQQAILLCAHPQKLQNAQGLIELHAAEFGDIEAMSWLSVSVMLRPELANHISAEFPQGKQEVLKDRNHVEFQNGVELGTIMTGAPADAKNQSYKVAHRAMYPAAPAFPDAPTQQQIGELQGMTLQRARDGQHLMAVFSKSGVTKAFTSFLKNELSVGTVTITATNGVFEMPEGHWRAPLVKLLEALQPLLPAK